MANSGVEPVHSCGFPRRAHGILAPSRSVRRLYSQLFAGRAARKSNGLANVIRESRGVLRRSRSRASAPIYAFERVNSQMRWYAGDRLRLNTKHLTVDELVHGVAEKAGDEIGQELGRILAYIEQLRFSDGDASIKSLEQVVVRCLAWIDRLEFVLSSVSNEDIA